jgi:two-component system, OmpR family, sensor kinase
MRLPRGIRARLTLGLLLIVGGALAVASLLVVPFLEQQLVDAKLDQLQRNAERTAASLVSSGAIEDPDVIQGLGAAFGARVVLYQVFGPPLTLGVAVDSAGGSPGELARDPVALEAAAAGKARGRVTRGGVEYGEAAVQLFTGDVLLLSGSLTDQLETVTVVKQRLALATAAALLVAGLLGSWAAGIHARRIGRIERAAEHIARGHFDEPLVDQGDDELGQLAASFDRMRVQLAQLDLARKEFVANASHELRTPLFSLAGFLELLADEEMDDATRAGFLATTREQVDRLTRLAGDLLDLSRLDAGQLHVERVEVDLTEILAVLGDELRPLADATGHALGLETSGSPVWALADEERVLQIGRALAGNALAHTPAGSAVTLGAGADPQGAVLTVSDDGPGIPADQLERIFDRFYRVDGAHAHGSGLGLAIAREVAARMDGEVTVASAPGRTTFTVTLPVAPPDGPGPVST